MQLNLLFYIYIICNFWRKSLSTSYPKDHIGRIERLQEEVRNFKQETCTKLIYAIPARIHEVWKQKGKKLPKGLIRNPVQRYANAQSVVSLFSDRLNDFKIFWCLWNTKDPSYLQKWKNDITKKTQLKITSQLVKTKRSPFQTGFKNQINLQKRKKTFFFVFFGAKKVE